MDSIEELKKLKQDILKCQKCGLCKTVTNKVIGKGSSTPDVLIIGEAPGEEEDKAGKPFVGRSGKRLDKVIAELGVEKYTIINTIKCRPPNNRDPLPEEMEACKPFFEKQIKLLNPKKIIAVGKVALKQLGLSGDTILSRIGTVEKSDFGDIMILPHPAYLLRNPSYQLPMSKIKDWLSNSDTADKVQLEKFELNFQKAKNLASFEMISPELAGLHHFCKMAEMDFVDVNQKDLCKINKKLTLIKKFDQTNEIDLFESDLNSVHKDVQLFLFYSIEKGNIVWLGWTDRLEVDMLEMGFHFKAKKNCKKIMYDTLKHMSKLMKIMIDKEKEEEIEIQPFVHLHTHSEYSIGDGYGSMKQIAEALHKKGFAACALTDHGTLAGTFYWQKALLEYNIKPIFGYEAYIILHEDGEERAKKTHITIIVKNEQGWKNLNKIHANATRQYFYYKPRILLADLYKYHEGLVILSGCSSSYASKMVQKREFDKAEKFLLDLYGVFKDDFYLEMMPNRLDIQKAYNAFLHDMVQKHRFKYVITTDSHYPYRDDEKLHKAVKAISYRKTYEESGFDDNTFYLLQHQEIKQLIKENHLPISDADVDLAFKYSMEIADKCNFKIEPYTEDTLPKMYEDAAKEITQSTIDGLKKYTPYSYEDPKIKERIDMELDRFISKQYENYFLIVRDYVKWCKENDIMVGPGRGSCGGSLASYALNITEVDPLQFELLFDRFISEIRKDAPDIDLDFEDIKREKLFKHFKEKYGEEHVAKIITYSTWHAKGALRDIGRIFKIPTPEINKICNLVVERSGGDARSDFCLLDTFTEFEQAKIFYDKYKLECDIAIGLESHIRHRGVHAAAVTITEHPASEYIPIEKVNGEIVTAWEKKATEYMGLIKFDILGLKTLSVISDTIKLVKQRTGKNIVLPRDYEDPKVYEKVFSKGRTLGVFQFETTGLSKLSKQLGINNFKLAYDATTLYRPGPLHSGETADYILRHQNKKEWKYDHKLLEPITRDTYGLILYQEQVMKVMFDLGSFSWATAESARKIMTKSQGKDAFNKMRKEFCENSNRDHGLSKEEAGKIFDVVSTFGSYGFNKSHAVEYSIISYWCAWLKTYYPAEFFTALLSREEDANKMAYYIREAREFGDLNVLTPHINYSKIGFGFHNNDMVAGFDSIKGIAGRTGNKIIKGQPYKDMEDYIRRGKPTISIFKALACSGAFDELYHSRKYLYDNAEKLAKAKKTDSIILLADAPKWSDQEREIMMMQYLDLPSETPLIDTYEDPFKDKIEYKKIGELEFDESVPEVWIKGIVTFINFKQEGLEGQWTMFDDVLERRYAHLNVSDGTGNVLVHLSPEQYTYYKRYLEKGTGFPVIIRGHSIKNFNKIYCDAMIDLNDIDHSNPILNCISGEVNTLIEKAKEKYPNYEVGMIKNVAYKVSQNKNAYARLTITGHEDEFLMCFKLTSDIFISGEVVVFTLQKPFVKIAKRIKNREDIEDDKQKSKSSANELDTRSN